MKTGNTEKTKIWIIEKNISSLWQLSENKIAVTLVFTGLQRFSLLLQTIVFFFLVHFWNCSHFTFRYELIIRSETGNILRAVICFHLLSKFHQPHHPEDPYIRSKKCCHLLSCRNDKYKKSLRFLIMQLLNSRAKN